MESIETFISFVAILIWKGYYKSTLNAIFWTCFSEITRVSCQVLDAKVEGKIKMFSICIRFIFISFSMPKQLEYKQVQNDASLYENNDNSGFSCQY